MTIEDIETRLRLKYEFSDVPDFYVLEKAGSTLVNDFRQAATAPEFWEDASEYGGDDIHTLWFLAQMGIGAEHLDKMIDRWIVSEQTVEGYMHSNQHPHSGPMRVLVALRPNSKTLANALGYWAKNWIGVQDPAHLAIGILALTELDQEVYAEDIEKQVK
jgi:hypothetical protein